VNNADIDGLVAEKGMGWKRMYRTTDPKEWKRSAFGRSTTAS
jgi:hypothetical protein